MQILMVDIATIEFVIIVILLMLYLFKHADAKYYETSAAFNLEQSSRHFDEYLQAERKSQKYKKKYEQLLKNFQRYIQETRDDKE